MTGEHEFQPGDLIRIALPDSNEDRAGTSLLIELPRCGHSSSLLARS
jgi:hypothetical protein